MYRAESELGPNWASPLRETAALKMSRLATLRTRSVLLEVVLSLFFRFQIDGLFGAKFLTFITSTVYTLNKQPVKLFNCTFETCKAL